MNEAMAERRVEHLVEKLNLFEQGVKRMVFGKYDDGAETDLLITTNTIDGKPNCEVLFYGRNRKNDLFQAQKLYFLNASSWPQEKDFLSVYCSL